MDFRNNSSVQGSRGLRNNNPGNMRPSGDNWVGMVGTADNFIVFKDAVYGIRALAKDIYNKYEKGYNTITKIITRYLSGENNPVTNYIARVSDTSGIPADQVFDMTFENLGAILRGMINVELGPDYSGYVTDEDIMNGIDLLQISGWEATKEFAKDNPGKMILVAILILLLLGGITYFVFRFSKLKTNAG